jgi:ribosomal protein RSM22 (predicted rRNA methylase)
MVDIQTHLLFIKNRVDSIFQTQSWSWNAKRLAEDVLQLSDFYIQNPTQMTPWDQAWAQRALLVYFWPLNAARTHRVLNKLQQVNFFDDVENFLDFGAGTGTASWLLKEFKSVKSIESSLVPRKWFPDLSWEKKAQPNTKTCTFFSYSLTELAQLPGWAEMGGPLVFVEPSTQSDGRRLLELRKKLLSMGYSVWAPCSHQQSCPLLEKSKSDWCHDRVAFEMPFWMLDIEKYLPMKNRTLTMSYLAVKKIPPADFDWARLTGDQLFEKGKTRQLVCRGPEREFLAWMNRDGEAPTLARGDRVRLEKFEQKSNELRVSSLQALN